MSFFCPSKHGKNRNTQNTEPPETPLFPRHITPGQAMNMNAQRRSTAGAKEQPIKPKTISAEAQMTSSAGQLEALLRRENARKQMIADEQQAPDFDLVVLQNFNPTRKEELLAFKNDKLKEVRRLGDWIYAINIKNRAEGYIPAAFCTSAAKMLKSDWPTTRRERTRSQDGERYQEAGNYFDPMTDLTDATSRESKRVHTLADSVPFVRENKGLLVVMFDFEALNENDLECEKGDVVTLLNSDDPDWWWVSHQDQSLQGFIPSSFARTYQAVLDALEQVENSHQLRSLNNPEASVPNATQPSYCYSSHQPNFTHQREKPLYSTQPIRTNPKFFQSDTNLSQPLQIRTDFADRANFGSNADKRQTQKQTYQVENSVTLPHRIAKEPYNVQNTPHNMGGTSQRISKHQAVSRIDISSNSEQNQPNESANFTKSFLVTEKYEAMNSNQLSVVPGETLYVNMNLANFQSKWILAQSPRLKTQGYVPLSILA